MTRVYYHLEPKGDVYREALRQEYLTVTAGLEQIIKKEKTNDKQQKICS